MVLNTEKDIDIDKLYTFIKSHDLHMKIHPVIPCGRAAGHPHAREIYDRYVDIMERLYETAMSDLDFEGTIEPLEEMMRAILSDSHLGNAPIMAAAGKIFCVSLLMEKWGSVVVQNRKKKISDLAIFKMFLCKKCMNLIMLRSSETVRISYKRMVAVDARNGICAVVDVL